MEISEQYERRGGTKHVFTLPDGHEVLKMWDGGDGVHCLVSRPDGDNYLLNLSTVIQSDGVLNMDAAG